MPLGYIPAGYTRATRWHMFWVYDIHNRILEMPQILGLFDIAVGIYFIITIKNTFTKLSS